MCGIAGIAKVHRPGQPPPADAVIPELWLDVLDANIAHRGPDGAGRFRARTVRPDGATVDIAFVHRRLSIIDHSGGFQPMFQGSALLRRDANPYTPATAHACPGCASRTPAPSLAVVFNGCIYNHRDLRHELQAAGHVFTTDHSDTEVILHAYRQWGEDFPSHVSGMFALCIWDGATGQTVAARDLAGEKPLYECVLNDGLYLFASTHSAIARTLRAIGAGNSGVAPALAISGPGLACWLRHGGSMVSPSAGIAEVEPRITSIFCKSPTDDGSFVEATSRGCYEDLPGRSHAGTTPQAVDAAISHAVRSCLESDVPLGFFLSGGVDSSLIAHHAARQSVNSTGRIRTYCVRMPDPRYDESAHAQAVAAIIGSDHTTLECDARPAEQLVSLIRQLGLPFGDSSLLPTFWVSAAARLAVKVAISGDGGDELFAGYERHTAWPTIRRFRSLGALLPQSLGGSAHPKSTRSKLTRAAAAARHGYPELTSIFGLDLLKRLLPTYNPAFFPARFTEDAPRYDFENYLPDDLLRKSDTAAMAVALELRSPLLSREIVRLGLSTPLSTLTPRAERKGLLRAAARLHLPAHIVDRPKMGFAVPIGDWFRSDYGGLRQLLADHLTSTEPWGPPSLGIELNTPLARRMLDHHLSGRRDHSQRLYLLLVLSIWARDYASPSR